MDLVLVVSPRSLLNYAHATLLAGLHAAAAAAASPPLVVEHFAPHGDAPADLAALTASVEQRVASAAAHSSATRVFVLLQLHGAHHEQPVAFDVAARLLGHRSASASDTLKLALLVHRPEEVLERARRGLYAAPATAALLRDVDVVVLLGDAMLPEFAARSRRAVAIPHGFFNLIGAEQAAQHDDDDDEAPAVVGSWTTWSDMRWVSDVLKMHAAARSVQLGKRRGVGLLFCVSGLFRAYTCADDALARSVDELALLRHGAAGVLLLEGSELDAACSSQAFAPTQRAFRRWLWERSDAGAKVVVIASQPRLPQVLALQAGLFDFNVQLYRELLCDFAPKVEYSGTLHERVGSSIPVVFDSPSMRDVEREGLQCITVKWPGGDAHGDAAAARAASLASAPHHPSTHLFFPDVFYPDFAECLASIAAYVDDPARAAAVRLANANAAHSFTPVHVAQQYLALFESLS